MKTILIASAAVCLITAAQAEPIRYELPAVCDDTVNILRELAQDNKEVLVWGGEHANDNSRLALFENARTGTWTLLKMTPKISCIIGVGKKSEFMLGEKT